VVHLHDRPGTHFMILRFGRKFFRKTILFWAFGQNANQIHLIHISLSDYCGKQSLIYRYYKPINGLQTKIWPFKVLSVNCCRNWFIQSTPGDPASHRSLRHWSDPRRQQIRLGEAEQESGQKM
jgi:hypothetical protein